MQEGKLFIKSKTIFCRYLDLDEVSEYIIMSSIRYLSNILFLYQCLLINSLKSDQQNTSPSLLYLLH